MLRQEQATLRGATLPGQNDLTDYGTLTMGSLNRYVRYPVKSPVALPMETQVNVALWIVRVVLALASFGAGFD